jgi:zinc ribbon protein
MQSGVSFCTACGNGLTPGARFCSRCGATVAAPSTAPAFVQGSGYAGRPGGQAGIGVAFAPAVLPQLPGNAVPEEILRKWTWGAFWGTPLWAFWQADTLHKVLGIVLFVLSFSTGIFSVALLGYGIYLGFNGNRIAAANRRFASLDEFLAVQRAWSMWGFIVFLVELAVVAGLLFLALVLGVFAALLH